MYVICIKQLAAYLKTHSYKYTESNFRTSDRLRTLRCVPGAIRSTNKTYIPAGIRSVVVSVLDSRGKGRKFQTGQAKLFPHNRIRVRTPTREKRDEKSKSE